MLVGTNLSTLSMRRIGNSKMALVWKPAMQVVNQFLGVYVEELERNTDMLH